MENVNESVKVQRRVHVIGCHLEAHPHPNPLIASSICRAVYGPGLEGYRRKDSTLDFARQGSESQPPFMRQSSTNQTFKVVSGPVLEVFSRKDNSLFFARQGSETLSPFMRQSSSNQEENEWSESVVTTPLTTTLELKSDSLPQKPPSPIRGSLGVSKDLASDGPCFARLSKAGDQKSKIVSLQIKRQRNSGDYYGFEWQPRMDMLEANKEYTVTVEVPGVDPDGIRVEVDAHWLIVSGTRPSQLSSDQKTNGREAFFHHRELAYGPFKAMCHIPGNTNMDAIAAEITEGMLLVHIPKVGM